MHEQQNQRRMDERIEYGWKIDHIKTLAELIGWAEEDLSTFVPTHQPFIYHVNFRFLGMGLEWRKKKKAGTGGLCSTIMGTH
jgi:hypothetical protein